MGIFLKKMKGQYVNKAGLTSIGGKYMRKTKVCLFVEKNNDECKKIEEILVEMGIPYEKIDIDDNGIRGYMMKDFGTTKVPLLVTPNAIVIGLEAIKKYLEMNKEVLL